MSTGFPLIESKSNSFLQWGPEPGFCPAEFFTPLYLDRQLHTARYQDFSQDQLQPVSSALVIHVHPLECSYRFTFPTSQANHLIPDSTHDWVVILTPLVTQIHHLLNGFLLI